MNCDRELGDLRRAVPDVGRGIALAEVALGERARRLGQAAERRREAEGDGRGHDHGDAQGHGADGREQAATFAIAVWRNVYGFERRTPMM